MKLKEKIAEVQNKMQPLKRDTSAFKYSYARLDQIQDKLNPLLREQKLLWTTPIRCEGGSDIVYSVITDLETDETMEASVKVPEGLNAQMTGSAITYFRRYTILALLNLETEDDDGKSASKPVAKSTDKGNAVDLPF